MKIDVKLTLFNLLVFVHLSINGAARISAVNDKEEYALQKVILESLLDSFNNTTLTPEAKSKKLSEIETEINKLNLIPIIERNDIISTMKIELECARRKESKKAETKTPAKSIERKTDGARLQISHGSALNRGKKSDGKSKDYMEDFVSIKAPFTSTDSFFAIYDGHGGTEIAKYCQDFLADNIRASSKFSTDLQAAIVDGISRTDSILSKSAKMALIADKVGTCAIMAIFRNNYLVVANLGDSKAIISNNGRAIPLSIDQKAGREDEAARIKRSGGIVAPCLGGIRAILPPGTPGSPAIAISRSIGDHQFRSIGIINIPELRTYIISKNDQFLILGCDGIFEKRVVIPGQTTKKLVQMTDQEAVEIVKASLVANRDNPNAAQLAAQALVDSALANGSIDNLSAIVILFDQR